MKYIIFLTALFISNFCFSQTQVNINSIFTKVDDLQSNFLLGRELFAREYNNMISQDSLDSYLNSWSTAHGELIAINDSISDYNLSNYSLILEKIKIVVDTAFAQILANEKAITTYKKFESLIQLLNVYKENYFNDIHNRKLNEEISKLQNLSDSINANINDKFNNLRKSDSLNHSTFDSLVSLSNGPFFVGPSLYVENTYGFNFFIGDQTMQSIFVFWPDEFSIMPEVLFFSDGVDRRFGGSLYFGYSFWEGKIIPQVMAQYLDDKRRLETSSSNNFNMGFGVLFKNREWMLGFSYSPVSGGGIKLLIGL